MVMRELNLESMLGVIDNLGIVYEKTVRADKLVDNLKNGSITDEYERIRTEIYAQINTFSNFIDELCLHEAFHNSSRWSQVDFPDSEVTARVYSGNHGYVVSFIDTGRKYDESVAKSKQYPKPKRSSNGMDRSLGGKGLHEIERSPYLITRDIENNQINLMCHYLVWKQMRNF